MRWDDGTTVNGKEGGIWKEVVVAYYWIFSCHSPGRTGKLCEMWVTVNSSPAEIRTTYVYFRSISVLT